MATLKQKTVNGLFWSLSETIGNYLSSFIVGIFLARILSPSDYGLVGMIMVFIVISDAIIDSGLNSALIQKKDVEEKDYSTVFIFNFVVSSILFLILYSVSGLIADFYNQTLLKNVLRLLSTILIINSISLIQFTKLTKDLNFKSLTKISVLASIISGIFGIILALKGFGVWSLVYKTIIHSSLRSVLYWYESKWFPKLIFDTKTFKNLFNFSFKVLLSSLINRIYGNVFILIVGKIFSPADLGFYSRADSFNKLASSKLTLTFQKVTYPVLSKLQDDNNVLMSAYRKVILNSMYITSFTMATMFAISEPLIIILVGYKWSPSIILLKLLCIGSVLFPLHSINLNLLKVKGRSDLFLRLEIIKKAVSFPVIIGMSFFGIKYMIIGGIGTSFIAFWINTYYTGQLIDYTGAKQLWDIFPSLLLGSSSAFLTFLISLTLPDIMWLKLIVLTLTMITLFTLGSVIFKFEEFKEIKSILLGYLPKKTVLSQS